jgi:ketosteroid isomerase-like protein
MTDKVATVQAMYAAFGAGDLPGVLEHLAPDVEWEHDWGSEPLPLYRTRRGIDAVPAFFRELADFEYLRFEPLGFPADGDLVAVPLMVEMRYRPTGRTFRDLEMHLWTFGPGGKVLRFRNVLDTRQLAAVMGAA